MTDQALHDLVRKYLGRDDGGFECPRCSGDLQQLLYDDVAEAFTPEQQWGYGGPPDPAYEAAYEAYREECRRVEARGGSWQAVPRPQRPVPERRVPTADVERVYSCLGGCLSEATPRETLLALPALLQPDEVQQEQPQRPWLIPGVMCQQGRIVLVGFEGDGKSTLLRQVAVAGAAGVHPFTGEPVAPIPVLLVDLENHPGDVQASVRGMLQGQPRPPGLRLRLVPEGIDLLADQHNMRNLLQMVQPALIVIGPVYKMLPPSEGDESNVVKQVTDLLAQWSTEFGVAWLIEAHAPLAQAGPRPLRPAGSRLWQSWPEVGLGLRGDGQIQQYRKPRWAHEWPARLARGGHPYPWTVVTGDAKHAKQEELRAAVMGSLSAGEEISKRQLMQRVPGDNTAISKAIDELIEEGALRRRVEGQTHFLSIP